MAPARWSLGVDPGRSGAAVLLDGRKVVAAATWKPSKAGGEAHFKLKLWGCGPIARARADSPYQIGLVINRAFRSVATSPWRLGVEDTYVRVNPKTSLSLARWTGMMVGSLAEYSREDIVWLKATDWRKFVLSLSPWTNRKNAKEAARKYIPPLTSGGFDLAARACGGAEHLADATGIALWLATPKGWDDEGSRS